MIRLALAQINVTVGYLAGNADRILEKVREASAQDADVVVFPELALTGYPPEDLLLKDHFVHDNLKQLDRIVQHIQGVTAVIGFADRDKAGHIYNAAAIVSDQKIKAVYHKQSLPNYGVFDEKRYFSSGKSSSIFKLNQSLIGVSVCEDIWDEHGVYHRQIKEGARLLLNLSSSPYDVGKISQRIRLLKKRAKDTKSFIGYVNLVGGQDELVFDGGSHIIDPQGKVIAAGKPFAEDLIIADLDIPTSKQKAKKAIVISGSTNVDIRTKPSRHKEDQLSRIERIYRALVLGTHDYIQKSGFQKVVIGVSGGIDSAVVAAIAVDALGCENVVCVSMPSGFTSEGTRSDAMQLAKNLGVQFQEIPIKSLLEAYLVSLKDPFKGTTFDLTEENLQARIRGNLLMAFSNKFGWMVLTTGNKSEVAVGYCTLYGDMSGGFAVIKDVPKTEVYAVARFINQKQKGLIPESIMLRAPSAELRADQKDSDTLPDYDDLDPILEAYVEDHSSVRAMTKRFKKGDIIQKVIQLVDRSEYKRRQAPPGIKITSRAFGKDWRLPIINKYKEF